MKSIEYRSSLLLLALLCPTLAIANNVPNPIQDLHQTDIYHQAACKLSELQRLKKSVDELSAARNPNKAWELVKTFLCGDGKEAERYIVSRMPETILSRKYDWEVGKEVTKQIPRSLNLMRRKKAWEANAITIDSNIRVFFMPSQYCVMSIDIALTKGEWHIVGIGSACD